jgi:hypothetical protein
MPGWGWSGSCAGSSSSRLGVGPLTWPAHAGVGGVDLLLTRRESSVAAGVRIETPTPLRDPDRVPAAVVGGVGQGLRVGPVQGVDDVVLAGGTHVVAGTGQHRREPYRPAGWAMTCTFTPGHLCLLG